MLNLLFLFVSFHFEKVRGAPENAFALGPHFCTSAPA